MPDQTLEEIIAALLTGVVVETATARDAGPILAGLVVRLARDVEGGGGIAGGLAGLGGFGNFGGLTQPIGAAAGPPVTVTVMTNGHVQIRVDVEAAKPSGIWGVRGFGPGALELPSSIGTSLQKPGLVSGPPDSPEPPEMHAGDDEPF